MFPDWRVLKIVKVIKSAHLYRPIKRMKFGLYFCIHTVVNNDLYCRRDVIFINFLYTVQSMHPITFWAVFKLTLWIDLPLIHNSEWALQLTTEMTSMNALYRHAVAKVFNVIVCVTCVLLKHYRASSAWLGVMCDMEIFSSSNLRLLRLSENVS